MLGKYSGWPRFIGAYAHREFLRARLRGAVSWAPPRRLDDGCTAIVGMCHRLPGVLVGNLRCLLAAAWPSLKRVVIVVDGPQGCVAPELERQAKALGTEAIPVDIYYYTAHQARLSESLRLPYVFSWLSWSIALGECRTQHALIHDYDALVFGDTLRLRYEEFVRSNAVVQGIRWYTGNGIGTDDRLATTFEAFVDVGWIRVHHPLASFHKISYVDGVSRDYDTLLHLQHVHTPSSRRTTMPMPAESLVHPSQMIHQYTMFRRAPGAVQACAALPMIPFFEFLSGDSDALKKAADRLAEQVQEAAGERKLARFLGDDTLVNLARLEVSHVDWDLKQMVQACMLRGVEPFSDLYRYGCQLYKVCDTPADRVWVGDFSEAQREWVERCRQAA